MQKLSYRDQVIIVVFLILLIGVAGYMLLIKPKYEDIKSTQSSLESAQAEWNELEQKINQIDSIKERIEKKYDECVQLGNFFVDVKRAEKLEEFIRGFINKNSIYIKSNESVSRPSLTTLEPYSLDTEKLEYNIGASANLEAQEGAEGADNAEGVENQSLPFGTVTIDYTATRANLMQFMKDLKESGKTIELKSLTIDENTYNTMPEAVMTGNMSIDVYYADMISDLDIGAEIEAVKANK